MTQSDIFGFILCVSFGAWWAAAPQSVIRFYARFHGESMKHEPKPLGVRAVGVVWIIFIAGAFFCGHRQL